MLQKVYQKSSQPDYQRLKGLKAEREAKQSSKGYPCLSGTTSDGIWLARLAPGKLEVCGECSNRLVQCGEHVFKEQS
jgi:hypothetical protein